MVVVVVAAAAAATACRKYAHYLSLNDIFGLWEGERCLRKRGTEMFEEADEQN
jgi:hypothetical protein